MTGLATHADVTAGDGPADGLMRHADEGASFVDLEGKAGSLRGGADEVCCVFFHEHRITLNSSPSTW